MSRLIVLWRVTERCNLGCRFCGYDRSLGRSRREANPAVVHNFGEVLGRFRHDTGRRVLVSWLGGEPLLWRPWAEASERYRSLGIQVGTTTNGTSLARASMRALLLDRFDELTVSVDGFGDFHDAVRGRTGLFASIADSVQKLAAEKRAAGQGPLLRANVVLMRGNAGTFADLCREIARWGIDEITFNQLGGADRPEFYPENRLLPAQAQALASGLPALREELSAHGVRLLGAQSYLRRIGASSRGERLAPEDCRPGESFLFIDEAARAAPCSFTPLAYGVPLGELATTADLLALPARYAEARRRAVASSCGDCHSTQLFGKFAIAAP